MSGADPSSVDKIRAAIRNLDTQIKVSIHSVESISRRIETLRDEELQPQLLELVQGYVYDIPLAIFKLPVLTNHSNAMLICSNCHVLDAGPISVHMYYLCCTYSHNCIYMLPKKI